MIPKRYRIETASAASERHPERNEDAYFTLPDGILGVFDGLGSHPGSERASDYASIYCQGALGHIALTDVASVEHALARALHDADRGLTREFSGSATTRDIATTAILAAILWDEAQRTGVLSMAHAGDCRAHLHREGRIIFSTLDHSLTHMLPLDTQRLIQDEIASKYYVHDVDPDDRSYVWRRSTVTSCLKADYSHKQLRVDTSHVEVYPGDTILLSSDGIHDNLTTDEIAAILTTAAQPAWALVDAAQVRSREPKDVTIVVDGEEREAEYFRPKPDDMTAVTLQI